MKYVRLIVACALFTAARLAAVSATSEIVTPEQLYPQLNDMLRQAVTQSPRMLSRALDLEIAENDRIAARSGLLPSISASYSYYKSKDRQALLYNTPGGSSNPDPYTLTKTPYSASLSQPLYYWGERRNGATIGEIRKQIAEGLYRDVYRQLVQMLRAEYLRLVILKINAQRARYNQEYTGKQLAQNEERLLKKVVSEATMFGERINAERAQIATERADSDLASATRSFARLAGLGSSFSESDIPESIPEVRNGATGVSQLMAGFLSQKDLPSIDAAILRQQLKIENLNYEISRTRLWPKFSLNLGMSQDEQQNYYGTGGKYIVKSLYAGVSVNWTIFDGFASGAAVRSSLARRRQMENDYRQLTEKLGEDVQSQAKQIGYAAREMAITDRLLVAAEGNLRGKEEENKRGVSSEAEVGQMKLALFDAQINAYSARRSYLYSLGEFLGLVVEDPVLANLPNK